MSLDLGTLVGYLDLDDKKFDGTIDKMPAKIKGSGVAMGLAAGAVALGVGLALSGGITSGVDMAEAQAKLTAQLDLTPAEAGRIGGIAGKLYADAYGSSVEEVSSAVGTVVSSLDGMRNANASTVEAMTAKLLNLQTTFGVDVARAAQVAGQAVKAGLAGDANQAIDLLVGNLQRVPEAVRGDLLDAIDEYGPFLANMGLKGEEAFGVLAAASDKGMYGIDKTGDALKELSIRATDMSTTSVAAYKAAGLAPADMSAKFLAGGATARGALDQLVAGLQGIADPVARSNAAIGLFGTPLEDLGTTEIPKFLDSIAQMKDGFKSTEGAADKMGATINSGPKTSLTEVGRTFDSIVGKVGQGLVPILHMLTDVLNENPAILQAVALGLGVLSIAFMGVTIATWAMNTALLANPITWIVVGILALIAAVVLLAMNWGSVTTWITGVWGGFVGWLTDTMDGLLGWWGGVWDGFLGFLSDAWGNIGAFLAGALQFVLDLFFTYNPLGIIIANWGAIMAFFAGIPAAILGFFAGVGQWLLDVGHNLLVGLATGIAIGIMNVIYLFTQFPTDLLNALIGAAVWLMQTGTDILTGLGAGISAGWAAVVAFFTGIPGAINAVMVGAAVWLLTTGVDLLTGFYSGVLAGWANLVAFLASIPGTILAMLAAAGSWLVSTGTNLLVGFNSGITAGWNGVVGFFRAAPGAVIGFLAGAGSWLVGTGGSLIAGLSNGVQGMWGSFMGFLGGIPGAIIGALGGAGSWLYSAGRNLVDGLLNGVRSLAGSVGSFFLGLLPGWIVGPFKAALGIHSPSTVFAGFGRNIAQGIMVGLDDEQSALDSRVSSMVTVPTGNGLSGAAGAAGAGQGGPGSYYGTSTLVINGNVGWDADEVARQNAERQRQAAALAGLGDLVVVA